LKAIEKALPRSLRGKVDFLLVSIDPDRDTPEVLHAYRARHQLTTEHWTLLTGPAAAVKQLADMVGFQYYPGSQRQYAHSLLVTILDQNGEIVFQQAGVGASLDGAIGTLKKLATSTTETPRTFANNRQGY
jgi:protein SCO1/2